VNIFRQDYFDLEQTCHERPALKHQKNCTVVNMVYARHHRLQTTNALNDLPRLTPKLFFESGDQSCSIQKFVPQPKVLTLITMNEYLQIRKPEIKKPDG
jgi:hypothetical protein